MSAATSEHVIRRKYPRRKFRHSMGVLYRASYDLVMGHEIGEGGLAFFHTTRMEVGDLFVVSFQLPLSPFICVRGQIRNIQEYPDGRILYGCTFENLGFENKRAIRNFVNERSASET